MKDQSRFDFFLQLEKLLTMIQNKMKGLDPMQARDTSTLPGNSVRSHEDLNKLDDHELNRRKADMDKEFEKNRIRPGDEDFVYDKEVEFNEGKIESGWDEDDDYSDPDFWIKIDLLFSSYFNI